jgi:hypothetical protein
LRRTDYYPISSTNGILVLYASTTSHIDTGLTNGTTYFYTIFAVDEVNNHSVVDASVQARATPYSGAPISDTDPVSAPGVSFTEPDIECPSDVSNLATSVSVGQIVLTWDDPFNDVDWKGTRLVRKTGSYPTSPSDGDIIYNGQTSTFTDTNVEAGTTYYYAAFAYDDSHNYSDGTVAGAKDSAQAQ